MRNKSFAVISAAALSLALVLGGCGNADKGNPAAQDAAGGEQKSEEQQADAAGVSEADKTQESDAAEKPQESEAGNEADGAVDQADTHQEEVIDNGPRLVMNSYYDSINSETEHKEGDYTVYGTINIEYPHVINEGYDKLQDALLKELGERKKDTEWFRSTVKESLNYMDDDSAVQSYPWPFDDKLQILRADKKVVSYMSRASQYTGGAHGGVTLKGCTFDSESGKMLELKDVLEDFDGFYDAVIEQLEPRSEYLWDEWKETAHRDVYEDSAENGAFAWVLGKDYVELEFGDYELGAYATGHVKVRINDSENPGLIKKEFVDDEAPLSVALEPYENFEIDVNGDGEKEFIRVESEDEYDEDYKYVMHTNVTVHMGKMPEASEESPEENAEGKVSDSVDDNMFSKAYLMESPGGRYYVMVQLLSDNDWNIVYSYDVSDPEQGPVLIGEIGEGAFYEVPPLDPEHIILQTRTGLFGTFGAYRECYLSDGGNIKPYNEEYQLGYGYRWYDDVDRWYYTAKMDIEAFSDPEKSKEVTVPSGTKLYPLYTDDETYMVLETEDGKEVCIFRDEEIPEDEWEHTINGVKESDVLEGIMYAG